jgi:hypothetical protein
MSPPLPPPHKMQPALKVELRGRYDSLRDDVRRLNERSQLHVQSNEHQMGTMTRLHLVTNVLRYVYLVLLFALLVLYAYERVPEHLEDRDWSALAGFVVLGSLFVALPYYLMDVMLGVRRYLGD